RWFRSASTSRPFPPASKHIDAVGFCAKNPPQPHCHRNLSSNLPSGPMRNMKTKIENPVLDLIDCAMHDDAKKKDELALCQRGPTSWAYIGRRSWRVGAKRSYLAGNTRLERDDDELAAILANEA